MIEIRKDQLAPLPWERTFLDQFHGACESHYGKRCDASETLHLLQELRFVRARQFNKKYAELKARTLIPVDNEVNTGAETVTYRQMDELGETKIMANAADDAPRVDVIKREFSGDILSLHNSYGYSLQDLRRAAMAGTNLDQEKSGAARRSMERLVDRLAAFGNANAGLPGFLNFVDVPLVTLPHVGAWSGLTPTQIIENMNFMITSVRTLTLQVETPTTLLLDSATFELVATRYIDTTNDTTILASFLRNNPYNVEVEQWNRLDLADTAGTGPRIMSYKRDPEAQEMVIPQEFEILAPQQVNFSWIFNCHSRFGGIEWRYPKSAAYAEGHG